MPSKDELQTKIDLMRHEIDALRLRLEEAQQDTVRLDWLNRSRVVIMRAMTRPDQWKIETMSWVYMNDDLRKAIDRAITMSPADR